MKSPKLTLEQLRRLLRLSLQELIELRSSVRLDHSERLYAQTLIAYLSHDRDAHERVLSEIRGAEIEDRSIIEVLSQARFAARYGSEDDRYNSIQQCNALSATESALWLGEVYFVLGILHHRQGSVPKAIEAYRSAEQELIRLKMPEKAIRSKLNALALVTQINPNTLTRFTENFSIIEMARAQQVESFAAIAYKNLSQEYQALGALQVALQYARESVRVADASMGSRDEAFCRLQLATVLGELEMTPELEMELQACSAADFPEIRSAVALLENYYFGAEHKIDLNALSPIWKVRASSKDWCGPVLGELAGQLVALLSRGPLTRVEILDQLFSDIKDEASRVIRFQGMVARIRRKSPDLIYFEEPLYWLQKPEKGVSE